MKLKFSELPVWDVAGQSWKQLGYFQSTVSTCTTHSCSATTNPRGNTPHSPGSLWKHKNKFKTQSGNLERGSGFGRADPFGSA